MAEITGVNPILPPWPVRPRDEEQRRRKPSESEQDRKGNAEKHDDDEDPSAHIDEYA